MTDENSYQRPVISSFVRASGVVIRPGGVLEITFKSTCVGNGCPPVGAEIKEFSRKSRQRLAVLICSCGVDFKAMLTVTFNGENYPLDGRQVRDDFKAILKWLRRRFPDGFSYVWYDEFQDRGAPHIHILLTVPVSDCDLSAWADYWTKYQTKKYDLSPQGSRNVYLMNSWRGGFVNGEWRPPVWENEREAGGLKRYAVTYATKEYQKVIPPEYRNQGRFWGCSRDVTARAIKTIGGLTEIEIRGLIRAYRPDVAEFEVLPKYVFGVNLLNDGIESYEDLTNESEESCNE